MTNKLKIIAYGTDDFDLFVEQVSPHIGKGKPVELTASSDITELKTNPQLRYLHDIIADYLVAVLFEQGCIEARSPHLAKFWLKEHIGYGDEVRFKRKGKDYIRFVDKSFANASKKQMGEAIEEVIRVCAFTGVIVPECKKGE